MTRKKDHKGDMLRRALNTRFGCVCIALTSVLSLASLAPATASAGERYLYDGTFGGSETTVVNPYPLAVGGTAATAIDDSSGDVYVVDSGHSRIEKFSSSGVFLFMFGEDVNKTAIEEGRFAEANVCPAEGHPGDVCQAGLSSSEPGAIERIPNPKGESEHIDVAVDNWTGSPSQGDVYVSSNGDDVVTKFDSAGKLVTSWGNNGAGGSPNGQLAGTGSRSFEEVVGVSVGPSGVIWISSDGVNGHATLFGFSAQGHITSELVHDPQSGHSIGGGENLSLDSQDDFYIGGAKFGPSGEWLGYVFYGQSNQSGMASTVDPSTSELYVSVGYLGGGMTVVDRFSGSCRPSTELDSDDCVPVESFGSGHLSNYVPKLSVSDVSRALYAGEPKEGRVALFTPAIVPDVVSVGASDLTGGGEAALDGTVNPSGVPVTGCYFEWGLQGEGYSHDAACEPEAGSIPVDSSVHAVKAKIAGLVASDSYHFRLVAGNANDVNGLVDEPSLSADVSFGPPRVESGSVLEASATGATFAGLIEPDGVDTSVRFEYGTQAGSYTVATAPIDAGSGGSPTQVSLHVDGLVPATVYHYRVVAENVLGESVGADESFATQLTGASGLLDGRGWELVSSPEKGTASLEPIGESNVIQAAANGDALTYDANAPTENGPQGYALREQLLSVRGADGWSSRDIGIPHESATGPAPGQGSDYRFFSTDLSRSVVQPLGSFDPLSAQATEQTPYLRSDFAASPDGICAESCFDPLADAANVTSGLPFGEAGKCPEHQILCGPLFEAASPDGKHVVLSSKTPLLEGAPAGAMYEWSEGRLTALSGGNEIAGQNEGMSQGAVSSDGSRVFLSGGYMFDTKSGESLRLDASQGGSRAGTANPRFQVAAADGSWVIFADEQRLTPNSGAEAGKRDLYKCEIVEEEGELKCVLSDLTPKNASGESAEVQGAVIGAGESGEEVYFVAQGVLAGNTGANGETATPGDCEPSSGSGACNLYVSREGTISFIARLSAQDGPDWAAQAHEGTARVSPNGEWLAFMSGRSLTGYDNRDAVSGKSDEEVYLYHAGASGGTIVCASCDPTGARPHGVEFRQIILKLAGGFASWGESKWIAANIPGRTAYRLDAALYQSRYLSDSGRLFFNSSDALVPQDTNGNEDVYEFEPSSVGDCSSASLTFHGALDGCLNLVSSGTSAEESAFLDASESGDDVFFLTAAQLSKRDGDSALDVYDARVGGGEAPVAKPVECQGDACQAFVAPPESVTPGSLLYSGPGNASTPAEKVGSKSKATPRTRARTLAAALKRCRKLHGERKRRSCERQARRKNASASAKTRGKGGKR
ncbi:MAG: hypothetical protein WBV85_14470 [Solirubrobacteraceae bacterium]